MVILMFSPFKMNLATIESLDYFYAVLIIFYAVYIFLCSFDYFYVV